LAKLAAASLAGIGLLCFGAILVLGAELGWVVTDPGVGAPGAVYDVRDELAWSAVLLATVLVGSFLGARLRTNPVPWLVAIVGVGFLGYPPVVLGVAYAMASGVTPGWAPYVAWIGNWIWIVGHVGGVYLFLLFPDGRFLSRRWRLVGVFAGVYMAVMFLLVATWTELEAARQLSNPLGVATLGLTEEMLARLVIGFPIVSVISVASVVLRYVRSSGVERLQMKWMAFGGVCLTLLFPASLLGTPRWTQAIPSAILVGAILVAVTRYRLYDIDRLISRTVAYAALTVVLVGVYAAGVVSFGGLLRVATGGGGGDLAVAASTLAVAAAFQPARRRLRTAVDRRFNRARYDASREVETFATRLREEVDLLAVERDLREVVAVTVQPVRAALWLHPAGPRG
jgi:hypothetical protein